MNESIQCIRCRKKADLVLEWPAYVPDSIGSYCWLFGIEELVLCADCYREMVACRDKSFPRRSLCERRKRGCNKCFRSTK